MDLVGHGFGALKKVDHVVTEGKPLNPLPIPVFDRFEVAADRSPQKEIGLTNPGEDTVDGAEHFRVGVLAQLAHGAGQVVAPDHDPIQAGGRQDLVQIVHGLDVLNLDEDHDLLAGYGQVLFHGLNAVHVADGTESTNALGWVATGAHSLGGLFARADHGHHDAGRRQIQDRLDQDGIVPGHANDGRRLGAPQRRQVSQ